MSTTAATKRRSDSLQAVDEEYKNLERFHVGRRRIVLVDENCGLEGGFGIIRQAWLYQSAYLPAWLASRQYGPPQLVAVKQIKVSAVSNLPRVKRAFTREMLVWSGLEAHPGIAKFLGFYADFKRSEAWLLSPWEPNGNVNEFIKTHNLEVPEKISLVYDTIDALAFLHQLDPPVCHGDIKSANVLVTAGYRARLCDFGLAQLHEDSGFGRLETSTGPKGSLRWSSPEILNGAPRTPASDVYAWAWLVWEIMTGKLPYEESSVDFVIMRQIFEGPLSQVDGQSRLSDCLQAWDLMTRCWNSDHLRRPTSWMCKTTVTYLPRCIPAPTDADLPTRSAALLENLGDLESWKGNIKKSSAYLDEAMQLYQAEKNPKGVASVLRRQFVAADRLSDYPRVCTIATIALQHYRDLQDDIGIADAAFHLGSAILLVYGLDKVDHILRLLLESLEIRRTHQDNVGIVQCLSRIGDVQRCLGNREEALATLNEAVAIASRSGDRLGLARSLHMMSGAHRDLSDFVQAADALSKASMITRDVGWEVELSSNLREMGVLKTSLGKYHEAEQLLHESNSIARRVGSRYNLARGLKELAGCFLTQSKFQEAGPVLEESCLLCREMSLQEILMWDAATLLVDLKTRQGSWDDALHWTDHIIASFRSPKESWKEAGYLIKKGEILMELQRHDEAALHFEALIAICRENGYTWNRARAQLCAIPKTAMQWERRVPLLCDVRKLQRRLPQLITASLKFPVPVSHGLL